MTLLRELIDIPEVVHKGDFVLRLTEGVADPAATLRSYVVTPQLAGAFDRALGLVAAALRDNSSKGAYLHGSFGSGKSHFMAVLHRLLAHDPAAKGIAELAEVVARHDAALAGRDVLLLTHHMIGAKSLEAAVFGGYVKHCREHHPTAAIPPLYLAGPIFANAAELRETMGDDVFLTKLNEADGDDGGDFGDLGAAWDAHTYDVAAAAPPGDPARLRLVSDLVATHLSAYRDLGVGGGDEMYVPMDEGLAIVSAHARDLGYDAVVLFLDELILWLASRIGDVGWVQQEVHKVVKLVEASVAKRPIPIVSFIARQRDLRELVGDNVPGAEALGFGDILKHWEDRFDTITLEDRNLAKIARRRLLAPRDAAAKVSLDAAFEAVAAPGAGYDVLLAGSDRDAFADVYPFSPAFVDAIVAVSGALQRERTALRLMLQYLVTHRDDLAVGDVVPVGDLWELIAAGEEPFTEAMRRHFAHAKELYYAKLLPRIEEAHDLPIDDYRVLESTDPQAIAMRRDLRLVHTLLVAAMAPEAKSLKELTPARLVALNHGTFTAPIPGQEAHDVLARLRRYGANVGEIHFSGDEANPAVSLRLSGVDTEAILDKAATADTPANRRLTLRRMLAAQIGFQGMEVFETVTVAWRGTRRHVDVLFGDVRDRAGLSDNDLRASGERWKFVVDVPLEDDAAAGGAAADLDRVDAYRATHDPTRTVCWLPSLLSAAAQRDVGRLVVLEHVLTGDRFDTYASHLTPSDRPTARVILDNNANQLRSAVTTALEGAYGVRQPEAGTVDEAETVDAHFQSLYPAFEPRPPAAGSLGAGFAEVARAALAAQYPAHPDFRDDVTPAKCEKVLGVVRDALADPDGRCVVDKALRPVMAQIGQPLGLGEQHETAFVVSRKHFEHFERCHTRDGGDRSVAALRAWLDEPAPMGLPAEAANTVILAYADAQNLTFWLHAAPAPSAATVRSIDDACELRTQPLPTEADWKAATKLAATVFGLAASPLVTAPNVAVFVPALRDKAAAVAAGVADLVAALDAVPDGIRMAGAVDSRRTTADVAARLCAAVTAAGDDDLGVLAALASAELGGAAPASVARSISTAAANADVLRRTRWDLLLGAFALTDERAEAAAVVHDRASEALCADELALPLAPALDKVESDCVKLLATPPLPPKKGWKVVRTDKHEISDKVSLDATVAELRGALDEGPGRRIDISFTVLEGEGE